MFLRSDCEDLYLFYFLKFWINNSWIFPIAWIGLLTLLFCFLVWVFADNLGKASLLHWLLYEHHPPDIMQRRKKKIGAWVCLLWFVSHHHLRWAETWGSSLFERQERGSCCCGEIRELPLPAGQPLSSWGWPLSQWAAESPKLTGWNPGLIKTGAKPPMDFGALAQRVITSKGRLTPLFMGLFWWLLLGDAQTAHSSPPLQIGSQLQTEFIIRQHFISFSTISL